MPWTELARRQYGLISRSQLLAFDMSASAIDRMLRSSRLEETSSRGVFRVAGSPFTEQAAAWQAVLSTNSPLSYLSAAAIWEMQAPSDGTLHVTRLGRRKIAWPAGVRIHRVALREEDVIRRDGLLLTSRTETALDCMAWLPFGQACRFADRAVQQSWISEQEVRARLSRQAGRWGNTQLRRILPQLSDGAAAESERRMHRLLRAYSITGWTPNLSVIIRGARFEIDVAFPRRRIAVEIDGFDYHTRDRFQRDRTKQNALIEAGWTVLRFTWADIVDRPSYVVSTIRQLLVA